MRIALEASVEVIEKYAPNVRAAFDDFLAGLPARIANVVVIKDQDDAEQVQQPAQVGASRARHPRGKSNGVDA